MHSGLHPGLICAYVGSGLQLFVAGALFAWMPSYLGRAYDLAPNKAAIGAAGFILLMGAGMIICGMVTDRLTRHLPIRKWTTALVYASLSLVLLPLGSPKDPARCSRPHRGRRLRGGHRWSGGRDGREPDPGLDPLHGLRDVDPRQQPARSGRRPRSGSSPTRSAWSTR